MVLLKAGLQDDLQGTAAQQEGQVGHSSTEADIGDNGQQVGEQDQNAYCVLG